MLNPVFFLIDVILGILFWVIIIEVILSWLVAFNVINTRNSFVANVIYFLRRVTEPILGPLRRMIPPIGGLDLSPLIALIAIQVARYTLVWLEVNVI